MTKHSILFSWLCFIQTTYDIYEINKKKERGFFTVKNGIIIIYPAYDAIPTSTANVCRATVGVAVGTCVLLIIGVVIAVYATR